jgi:malonyl-CoA O-methyltransferase
VSKPQTKPADFALDPRQLRHAFERASAGYDRAAVLQAQVREQLLDRLAYARLRPEVIVDAGCGTGHAGRALKRRFRRARVIAVDLATNMLRAAGRRQTWFTHFDRVCADAARLPLADGSVDLIYSNLMLQWCNDLDAVLAEFRRVLKPHGLLTFSTFGPDTLKELRAAWAAADERTHVNRFIDMHDVGDAVVRAGLAEPVLDVEYFTLTYDDTRSLMRDLKAIGAHNVTAGRPHGLTGRGRLAAMSAAYEQQRRDGKLPATYEVVFGQAWGRPVQMGSDIKTSPTETRIPIAEIGRRGQGP